MRHSVADTGGGRRRGLTRGAILACALALVDEEGLDALSLRTLGSRLGVSQTAIYRHVPDKAALLDGIAEQVWREALAAFDSSLGEAPASGWRDAALRYAQTLLSVLRAHPNAVVLMLTHPISTSGQFFLVARTLARLAASGVELPASALDLVCALTVYTTGFAAAEVAPPAGGAAEEPCAELDEALASLSDDEQTALERLIAPVRSEGWSFSGQFETGLTALVAGWPA